MSVRKGSGWRARMATRVAARDGNHCAQCRSPQTTIWRKNGCGTSPLSEFRHTLVYPTSNLELDHKIALHVGGDNDFSNLQLLCNACHRTKTSKEQSARLKALFAGAAL